MSAGQALNDAILRELADQRGARIDISSLAMRLGLTVSVLRAALDHLEDRALVLVRGSRVALSAGGLLHLNNRAGAPR